MNITITDVDETVQFMDMEFGELFLYCGLAYVKTKPATGHGKLRFNAVGVGHSGLTYLWHDLVIPVDAVLSGSKEE